MEIVKRILKQMQTISKPQEKFLLILFSTIFAVRGKLTFTNMSRYSGLSEKTYRRQYKQTFNFLEFNQIVILKAFSNELVIAVMDCSFVSKSGKKTYGIDRFFNGSASLVEKGLEISAISIVNVRTKESYNLSVKQTPDKLPNEETRIDVYLEQLKDALAYLPPRVKHVGVDGFYTKLKFVSGVCEKGLHVIGKLRSDANLRYLYTGPQKSRGAHRKYAGKVSLNNISGLTYVKEVEPGVHLYTAVVTSISLKRNIRLAYLLDCRDPKKLRRVVFFSTDLEISPIDIYSFYGCRFQIEFIFRDAKQFTGLTHCQARDKEKLDFHFNVSLSAVNLARYEIRQKAGFNSVVSLDDYKRSSLNSFMLDLFISKLDLDPILIKNHPNFDYLSNYGLIAA